MPQHFGSPVDARAHARGRAWIAMIDDVLVDREELRSGA
jgi:hypothetical protein